MHNKLNKIFLVIILIFLSATVYAALPTLLVYPTNRGEGADKSLAESASRAISVFFNRSGVVESALFDKNSPTVTRAIMEGNLTAEMAASFASIDERLKISNILGYDYAVGSEVSINSGYLNIHLWIGKNNSKKPNRWDINARSPFNGLSETESNNSVETAANSGVIEALISVFSVKNPTFDSSLKTTPIESNQESIQSSDPNNEIDQFLKEGNLASAISSAEMAVNNDPTNPALRIKLARLYLRKGLNDQALYQLEQAKKNGASDSDIQEINSKLYSTDSTAAAIPLITPQSPVIPKEDVVIKQPDVIIKPTGNAVNKIAEGDSLWNKGDTASAIEKYKTAISMDPSEWRAYERLALIYAATSMYYDARETLTKLDKIQTEPAEYVQFNRNRMFMKTIDKQILLMISQRSADMNSFTNGRMTREKFSNLVKSNLLQTSSLSKFLEALPVFQNNKQEVTKRMLAIGLVNQSSISLQDYLETNDASSKKNAASFLNQAKDQMDNTIKN